MISHRKQTSGRWNRYTPRKVPLTYQNYFCTEFLGRTVPAVRSLLSSIRLSYTKINPVPLAFLPLTFPLAPSAARDHETYLPQTFFMRAHLGNRRTDTSTARREARLLTVTSLQRKWYDNILEFFSLKYVYCQSRALRPPGLTFHCSPAVSSRTLEFLSLRETSTVDSRWLQCRCLVLRCGWHLLRY